MGKTTISNFYCVVCGNEGIAIPRRVGQQREAGHLKRIFCLHCKRETNHAEIKPFGSTYTHEDFLLEFETGRFVQEQRVAIRDLPGCKHPECDYCINGKCWNAKGDVRNECEFANEQDYSKMPDLVYCADGTIREEYRR